MWFYKGQPIDEPPEGYLGFVYRIENTLTGKQYIGKKTFLFRKTKQVKGKRKKILVDSDWKTYYGSNKELIQDVEEFGEEHFYREILEYCKTKGEMSYLELRYQIDERVLEKPDSYYNGWITCKISRSHIKNLLQN